MKLTTLAFLGFRLRNLTFIQIQAVRGFIQRVAQSAGKDDVKIERKKAANRRCRKISDARHIKRKQNHAENYRDDSRKNPEHKSHQPYFRVICAQSFYGIQADCRIYCRSKRARVTGNGASCRKIKYSPEKCEENQ